MKEKLFYNLEQAAQEAAQIQAQARKLAGENKEPTKEHYQKASEQIDEEKKQTEIVLTPEQKKAKEEMIKCLTGGWIDDAIEIKDQFSLPEEVIQFPEFQSAAKEGMIKCLTEGRFNSAIKIKDKFSLPEEVAQSLAKEGMIKCLADGFINDAIEIKDKFNLNISSQEILQNMPPLQEMIEKIDNSIPGFAAQIKKSPESTLTLCKFINNPDKFITTIEVNQFLKSALFENPRFGAKLIVQYPRFDKLSQENIQFLFEVKKEILKAHPDINPEAWEFRQLMQEELKKYKNNPEILKALKENGINIDAWLNYSEVSYFNLKSKSESGEPLMFFETIQIPLNRIKDTIDSYAHTLKKTLKEYKPELSEFKIPLENLKEIEDQISQMQVALEKAKAEGNERKAQGIEKSIANLKKKMENMKTVALWDKLLGDIAAFEQLKDDVFLAKERLIQSEKEIEEKLKEREISSKTIQELKQRTNQAKEELKEKFEILERRIENFKTKLPELIAPCLGQERTSALLQEIEQNLAEQFDHWQADRRDLTNLFSEKSDQAKDELANQPLSIFVWARNPDIDMYQGNYTNCCIRIDSEHMGSESTIADYQTDLGIQIVNIWDRIKNEPVTAAWCWIGQAKNGDTALVVDNIESNTTYSLNYSEQLTKELFEYLQNYARSIGVKKIVLGKANNDLPTPSFLAKMKDDENEYYKLGGYNRINGYFLEAEGQSVKLLWEESAQKIQEEKGKEMKLKPIIKFKNLNISHLTEKDFPIIKRLERKIYAGTDLIAGEALIEDIQRGKGLEYSIIITGKRSAKQEPEVIGYIAAVEDETDEGKPSVYLEDFALIPEAQGQGIGWTMFKSFIIKLKEKAQKGNKPVLLDMHLRENSQIFMEKHFNDLKQMGVNLIEEALVPNYYDQGIDALYQVYEIKNEP